LDFCWTSVGFQILKFIQKDFCWTSVGLLLDLTWTSVQGSIETKSYPTKFRQNLFHLHLHLHHGSLLRLLLKVNEETDVFGEEQMLFLKLRKGRSLYTSLFPRGFGGWPPRKWSLAAAAFPIFLGNSMSSKDIFNISRF